MGGLCTVPRFHWWIKQADVALFIDLLLFGEPESWFRLPLWWNTQCFTSATATNQCHDQRAGHIQNSIGQRLKYLEGAEEDRDDAHLSLCCFRVFGLVSFMSSLWSLPYISTFIQSTYLITFFHCVCLMAQLIIAYLNVLSLFRSLLEVRKMFCSSKSCFAH